MHPSDVEKRRLKPAATITYGIELLPVYTVLAAPQTLTTSIHLWAVCDLPSTRLRVTGEAHLLLEAD